MKTKAISIVRLVLALIWLLFTVSLSVWWVIFGLRQITLLKQLQVEPLTQFLRYQRMLIWEGVTLVGCVLVGGVALAYFMFRELKEREALSRFFASFTHELKTPLASLRLQAESLAEIVSDSNQARLLERLLSDVNRLTIQLENSLYLARSHEEGLLLEDVDLGDLISELRQSWPKLEVHFAGSAQVRADRRGLNSIFQNLLANSWQHGKAQTITICAQASGHKVKIAIQDNGCGFQGEALQLKRAFGRHYTGSGSGIGLFLVNRLSCQMGGRFRVLDAGKGFCVELELQGVRS